MCHYNDDVEHVVRVHDGRLVSTIRAASHPPKYKREKDTYSTQRKTCVRRMTFIIV